MPKIEKIEKFCGGLLRKFSKYDTRTNCLKIEKESVAHAEEPEQT